MSALQVGRDVVEISAWGYDCYTRTNFLDGASSSRSSFVCCIIHAAISQDLVCVLIRTTGSLVQGDQQNTPIEYECTVCWGITTIDE